MPPTLPAAEQLEILKRGAVHLHTEPELLARLGEGRPLLIKAGFDPTAPDLHVGHTVLMQKMRVFQDLGHEVHFIIGDFTASIGDPTGKNATRPPLERDQILANAETYKRQLFKVLDPDRTIVDFNSTWLAKMNFSDVIKLAARYTVARMLERDDFSKRYKGGVPISVHEFLYPLAQAMDSVALKCDVELGGSDQLFNLLVGREVMRDYGLRPQLVLTMPLLEGVDAREENGQIVGDKMSKSLGNYIGIEEPPKEIYGKAMSISDPLMWRYYELLSSRPMSELRALKDDVATGKVHPKAAKQALSHELVARFHGPAAADAAQAEFDRVFASRGLPDAIEEATLELPAGGTLQLVAVLAQSGLATSNSDARRLVAQGGVTVARGDAADVQAEGERMTEATAGLGAGVYLVKVGKRKFKRITLR
jgi:tyrosyl-tRNA synthetase